MTDLAAIGTLAVISAAAVAFWDVVIYRVVGRGTSGDTICMERWLKRGDDGKYGPVPPPYCWRPLLGRSARWLGFKTPSYFGVFAAPLVVYGFAREFTSDPWVAFAAGLMLIGNVGGTPFNVRWPEYVEGIGQPLFIGALWAMYVGNWPAALVLAVLGGLARESIGLSVAFAGLLWAIWEPWALVAFGGGCGAVALAYLTRNEDDMEHHPLTRDTWRETFREWITKKQQGKAVYTFATCIQPLFLMPLVIPFTWEATPLFPKVALASLLVHWFFSLPASGVGRHMFYGFGLCIPFVVTLPVPWVWVFVMLAWFWHHVRAPFDETGGAFIGLRKTQKAKAVEEAAKVSSPRLSAFDY